MRAIILSLAIFLNVGVPVAAWAQAHDDPRIWQLVLPNGSVVMKNLMFGHCEKHRQGYYRSAHCVKMPQ
jgi:hypothetical protein